MQSSKIKGGSSLLLARGKVIYVIRGDPDRLNNAFDKKSRIANGGFKEPLPITKSKSLNEYTSDLPNSGSARGASFSTKS